MTARSRPRNVPGEPAFRLRKPDRDRERDLLPAALRITCPTLLVATDDRGEWAGEQAQAAADVMRDAHVDTIAGARVIPALEQPAATAGAIMAFWADVAGRVSPST